MSRVRVNRLEDRLGTVGVNTNEIVSSVKLVNGIKNLKQFADVVQQTKGFHVGTSTRQSEYVWNPIRPWSAHNGTSVLALGAMAVYDGTPATEPAFLAWTGIGNGCWEEVISATVSGGISNALSVANDAKTRAIQAQNEIDLVEIALNQTNQNVGAIGTEVTNINSRATALTQRVGVVENRANAIDAKFTDLASLNATTQIAGVAGNKVNSSVNCIKDLESAPKNVNTTYTVKGYHINTVVGGGEFVWNPDKSWADHNGGTVIAQGALAVWDGVTEAGLTNFLNWTGTGTGCWERLNVGDYVTPEMFGALGIGQTGGNIDTISYRAAIKTIKEGETILGRNSATYYLSIQSDNAVLDIGKSIVLDFNNSKIIYKPWKTGEAATVHSPAIRFKKPLINTNLYCNSISEEQSVLNLPTEDLSSLLKNDYIIISSNSSRLSWNGESSFSGWGELNQIRSVNNSTKEIELLSLTYQNYVNSAYIKKIDMIHTPKVINIKEAIEQDSDTLNTTSLSSDLGHFITFFGCVTPVVKSVNVIGNRLMVIFTDYCLNPVIDSVENNVTNSKYPGVGGHAYLIRHQRTTGATTKNCISRNGRHLVDYTSSYECVSSENKAIGCIVTPYQTHGFGERNITSINDSFYGCNGGWQFGNPSFADSKGGLIDGLKGDARNFGISVTSKSSNLKIKNCVLKGKNPFHMTAGSSDVEIYDTILTPLPYEYAIEVGLERQKVSNTIPNSLVTVAGNNPELNCKVSSPNSFTIGSSYYINLDNLSGLNGSKEFTGEIVITNKVNDTIYFRYVDERTTTTVLNTGTLVFPIYTITRYLPVKNFKASNVTIISNAGYSNTSTPVRVSCEGQIHLELNIKGDNTSLEQIVTLDSCSTQNAPNFVYCKLFVDTQIQCERAIFIRCPVYNLNVIDNICKTYTNCFIFYSLSLQTNEQKTISGTWKFINNQFDATSPINGVSNFDMWDKVVKFGGILNNNKYPLNSLSTHQTNKNYEFGTIDIYLKGETTEGTVTLSNNTCYYNLIDGRMFIDGRIKWNNFTGTGNMYIDGFPFFASSLAISCINIAESSLSVDIAPTFIVNKINIRKVGTPVESLKDVITGDFRFSFNVSMYS